MRRPILSALLLLQLPLSFTGCWRRGASARGLRSLRRAEPDPCVVLGLPPGTRDEDQVRGAFRRLAKVYHPDVPQTGDISKFQELQRAAQQLITGQAPAPAWDAGSLESIFTQTSTHVYASPAQRPPSVTQQPLQQADFAGTRTGRVDVGYCVGARGTNLRKTPRLDRITHRATPETLARVQTVLSQASGAQVQASTPLPMAGFVLEGHTHSIGEQRVADTAMALEKEFGVELLTILAGTWINFPMPAELQTVQDLANLVESKINS
ncbi:unnamed protein product [Effrenium voratum]|uniref:J domain-containing protein n=1 Tax=Effrenium voratum TaxID=2562239 RepID=A0AA36J015_9DINO|nr:unnamed protein product [Effrenium voratum]CAJ1441722.1 unnamed protein product [Effrenium voratum]